MKTKFSPDPENSELLFRDIKDLHAQYLKEVPSKRRTWPLSIRSRVEDLWAQGLSSHIIASRTGLPAQTLYSWRTNLRKSKPDFISLGIVPSKKKSLAIQLPQLDEFETRSIPPTVTVVLPGGVRIEGMSEGSVLRFTRELLR